MTRARILAISALTLVGFTVVPAGCAGARWGPDFEQDFRGGSRSARDAWFSVLVTRYGCDTVMVKASTPAWGVGATTCAMASSVMPQVVRAWSDSTGVQEEWTVDIAAPVPSATRPLVLGSGLRTSAPPTIGRSPEGRCRVRLRGRDPRDLRVSDITC